MIREIKRLFGFDRAAPVRATSYDAARVTPVNERHWAIGPQTSDPTPEARKIIRNRARYESANNSILYGMIETYARDLVASGPHLNFKPFGSARRELAIEYAKWSNAVGLVPLLKTITKVYLVDGEAFLVATDTPPFFRLIETERIWSNEVTQFPAPIAFGQFGAVAPYSGVYVMEGIRYDSGVAVEYCIDGNNWVPAQAMTHWFRQDFANQRRGVSRISTSLDMFAKLRRIDAAVTTAYETVAKIALVLESKQLAPSELATPFEVIQLVEGSVTTLPDGYGLNQVKAEHPTSSHRETAAYFIGAAARCFPMPLNKALGTSQDSNFASGSLDNIDYERAIDDDRQALTLGPVARTRSIFLDSQGLPDQDLFTGWDAIPMLNPQNQFAAIQQKLDMRLTSRTREAAKLGYDWETVNEELELEESLILDNQQTSNGVNDAQAL